MEGHLIQTRVSCFWKNKNVSRDYRTGISLHSHTRHSKESVLFIPRFAERFPVVNWALKRKCSLSAVPVDFNRAYWTPPLTAERALEVERNQIEDALGRESIVALTDHDNIEAPLLLRRNFGDGVVPISLEWSVPYHGTSFHFGMHNLPAKVAQEIVAEFAAHTADPRSSSFKDLCVRAGEMPGTLVVFNHPLWDLHGLGPQRHHALLNQFLEENVSVLHAMELNGMREWKENRGVMKLAERWQLPIISGGDRHGCEPSAALNLTNATSFAEFAYEIREERLSHVLFMPQYTDSMVMRRTQVLFDVIRFYPEYPIGLRRWDDRVFHPGYGGDEIRPLSALWNAPPAFLTRFFNSVCSWEDSGVRRTVKHVLKADVDMHLQPDSPPEAAL
jgi:hypothetical protein